MAPKWTKALPRNGRVSQTATYKRHVVSKPGAVEIYLIVHGATSLPSKFDGSDPVPFASVKSIANEKHQQTAQSATLATVRPTHSPVWDEILLMEVPKEDVEEEELIFAIADNDSKEKLVTYRVPVNNFVPFHPYHLELIQPTKCIGSGIRTYVSVQRLESYLPRLTSFGFCGLEVILSGFHKELGSPVSPLLAVARIVPDYSVYKDRILTKQAAGITTSTVTLPSPHPSAFEIPDKQIQGFPQITTASNGGNRPMWNHTFMFTGRDTATMFTTHSALVLEYYTAHTSMSSITWTIRNPVGFSTLLLDDEIFSALQSEEAKLGVKIQDLLIQSTEFFDSIDNAPGVDLYLRLVNSERPDTMISVGDLSLLPMLTTLHGLRAATVAADAAPIQRKTPEELLALTTSEDPPETPMPFDRRKTQILTNEDEYPPSDILESLLPELKCAVNASKLYPSPKSHQAVEVEKFMDTMRKMSIDIAQHKSIITKLQDENHALKRQLMTKKNLSNMILIDISTGVLSIEELAGKYIATKAELESESAELKKYQDKVQQLQNQLIKANDREKKYLGKSSFVPPGVDKKVNDKQERMKILESTALQQENVIVKMEKLLADCLRDEGKPISKMPPNKHLEKIEKPTSDQAIAVLIQENARLRMELNELQRQRGRFSADTSQLLRDIDQAHSRVSSLENQLNQNSRQWAQEKHELTVRLQEHRNGFIRKQQLTDDFLRHSYSG